MNYKSLIGRQVDGHVDSKVFKAHDGTTYPYETHHVTLPNDLIEHLVNNNVEYRIRQKGGVYTQDFRPNRLNIRVDHRDGGFFITEVFYG